MGRTDGSLRHGSPAADMGRVLEQLAAAVPNQNPLRAAEPGRAAGRALRLLRTRVAARAPPSGLVRASHPQMEPGRPARRVRLGSKAPVLCCALIASAGSRRSSFELARMEGACSWRASTDSFTATPTSTCRKVTSPRPNIGTWGLVFARGRFGSSCGRASTNTIFSPAWGAIRPTGVPRSRRVAASLLPRPPIGTCSSAAGPSGSSAPKTPQGRSFRRRVLAMRRGRLERPVAPQAQTGGPRENIRRAAARCYFRFGGPAAARLVRARYQASVSPDGRLVHSSWSRRREPAGRILYYHRVNDDGDPFFPSMPVDVFERQMRFVARRYKVVSLGRLIEHLESGSPETVLAITFDDGYRDNYESALPILQRYGLKATIFLTYRKSRFARAAVVRSSLRCPEDHRPGVSGSRNRSSAAFLAAHPRRASAGRQRAVRAAAPDARRGAPMATGRDRARVGCPRCRSPEGHDVDVGPGP